MELPFAIHDTSTPPFLGTSHALDSPCEPGGARIIGGPRQYGKREELEGSVEDRGREGRDGIGPVADIPPDMGEDATQEAPFPSLLSRYVQVFVSPGALFDRLVERPAWGGAMVLGAALVLAGAVLLPPELYLAAFRQRLLEQGQTMPPGLENGVMYIRLVVSAFAFLSWFVILAFFAGLVTFVFAFIMGDEGTYRQYLAVMAHAQLIAATSGLVVLPLRIMAEDVRLLLSLGTFAFFLEDGYVLRLLSFLDLFGLWGWALVGLGAAKIGRRDSWASAAAPLLLIPVGIAAVIAIFTG